MNDEIEVDKGVKTNKKTGLIVLSILILLLLLAGGYRYYEYRKIKNTPDDTTTGQNQNTETTTNTGSTSDTSGLSNINSEISKNPNDPNLYAEKSNILYNSGDKASALAAVEEGLATNPDSELLKSKKDILTRDYFQSDTADTPRQ